MLREILSQSERCYKLKILITEAFIVMTDINEQCSLSIKQMLSKTQSEILSQYDNLQNIFKQTKRTQLSNYKLYNHIIDLEKGKALSFDVLYSILSTELKILCEYVNKNLETELIKHSSSAAVLFMMFISKKNRTLKLIIDYRELNKITVKNQYLLSLITEMLNRLSNIKIFSKLNIKNIYYCIKIQKDDE